MNLEAEIAQRLGVSPAEVRPVLETVIERIRKQVAHYGYARLAGLGTFRGHDGIVLFEPDPGLAESVNLRFAGLGDLLVDLPGRPPFASAIHLEEDEEVVPSAPESPWIDEVADEPDLISEDTRAEVEPDLISEDARAEEEPDLISEDASAEVETDLISEDASAEVETDLISEDASAEEKWAGRNWSLDETADWQEEADLVEDAAALPLQDEFPLPAEDVVDRRWRQETEWAENEEEEDGAPPEFDEEESVAGEYEDLEGPPFRLSDDGPGLIVQDEVEEDSEDAYASREPVEPEASWPEGEYPDLARSDWDDDVEEVQASWDPDEEDRLGLSDEESGVSWQEGVGDEARHPLGPMPPEEFEEADFSYILDKERSSDGDTVWLPPGEATPEEEALTEQALTEEALTEEAATEEAVTDERQTGSRAPEHGAVYHDRIRREPYGGNASAGVPERRTGVWIGAAVVVVIAAAAVAYFVLRPVEPDSPALIDQTPVAMTDSAAVAPDTTAAQPDVTAVVPDESGDDPGDSDTPAPPVQAQDPPTDSRLRSANGIDHSQGGFTLVVYSETSSGPAEQAAQRFRNQGYRTGLLQSQDGGVTRYRVGVGQFRSLDEATRARDTLAGKELPEDAWVYRIQ